MTLTESQSDSVRAIISLMYQLQARTHKHTHTQLNTYILLFIISLLHVIRILHHPHGEILSLAQNYPLIVMLLHWLLSK